MNHKNRHLLSNTGRQYDVQMLQSAPFTMTKNELREYAAFGDGNASVRLLHRHVFMPNKSIQMPDAHCTVAGVKYSFIYYKIINIASSADGTGRGAGVKRKTG